MARVTVEDCVQLVPNRFELVMMAAQRARDIHAGSSLTVDRDNDKNPVVALREIADQTVELEVLRESLIRGHQKPPEVDEPEDEIIELMAGEAGYVGEAQPEGMVGNNMSLEGDEEDDEDDFNALLDGPQAAAGEDEEE